MKKLRTLWIFTIANIKMYARNGMALFWSLFFPIITMGIFGVLNFGGLSTNKIGLVYDEASKAYAEQIQQAFASQDTYKFSTGDMQTEMKELESGDLTVIIEMRQNEQGKTDIASYYGTQNTQMGQIISTVTQNMLTQASFQMNNVSAPFTLNQNVIETHNLRYIDYMVPGIIGISLLQSNMFGVINAIVSNRQKGILRRIFATPLPKGTYLISNIITRTLLSMLQVAILFLISMLVFNVRIAGSIPLTIALTILGSLVFISFGFLISGIAKTEESASAIVMPMQIIFMFTGGVYFDRSVLPSWLFNATKPLPMTYLIDTLRDVMTKGYGLGDKSVIIGILALIAWLVGIVLLSIKFFKWEND